MSLTERELRAELERALGRRVGDLTRRPSAYRTSHELADVDVRLNGTNALELVLKEVGGEPPPPKPPFLHDPLRELDVYRSLLAGTDLGTARLVAGGTAGDGSGSWLLLERVQGFELYQVGELETWERVAAWLARAHETLAGSAGAPRLIRYDTGFYRLWLARARERSGGLDAIAARYDDVVAELARLPVTVLHGELYPSNVLVCGERISPVDWEMAAAGPGLVDLAALTVGRWDDEARGRIARAYHGACARPLPLPEFMSALERCRLHVSLQWLGWADGWTPPQEHAHDWLGEARRAAERLGL